MAQYIDKSALVADIERRIKSLHQVNSPREQAVLYECKDILSFINTLEVKDLELTWEDLATIEKIKDDFVKNNQTVMSDEEFYKEVLKRFNKNEK